MGTKVTLRQKPIAGSKNSLYLDFYPPIPSQTTDKTTRREFLNLFVYVPIQIKESKAGKKTSIYNSDKAVNDECEKHNAEALSKADAIRAIRQNILDKPEIYSGQEREVLRLRQLGQMDFIKYFTELSLKKDGKTQMTWKTSVKYLTDFAGSTMTFAELTKKTVSDFKEYLLAAKCRRRYEVTPLSTNSAKLYFTCFLAAINKAIEAGYIQVNPATSNDHIKPKETSRNYLTIEELNRLVKTDCKIEILKRAALFSALTGLRHSDILKLTWGEVLTDNTGTSLKFTQQKTDSKEMMPISEQAAGLLGERKKPTDKVFEGFLYSAYWNEILSHWILKADIDKDITFHCFRHTFATLQLSEGTDIYTVSKMLGHRDLKTTAIYAKVLDKAKREAVNRITLNF